MKIAAKDSKEFSEIEEKLKELPSIVLKRVDMVQKSLVGIELTIVYDYNSEQVIHVPSFTTQIKHFGDFIGIYAGDFFFRIKDENILKHNISYVMV